ncbi:MAG: hypothetical protein LBJ77_03210 [Holosporales bacterium]|nr:hypothetical protein [Holosporales bacterium]
MSAWLGGGDGHLIISSSLSNAQWLSINSYLAGYWYQALLTDVTVRTNLIGAFPLVNGAWKSKIENAPITLPASVKGDISPDGIKAVFDVLGQMVEDLHANQALLHLYQDHLKKAAWAGAGLCAGWVLWAFLLPGLKKSSSSTKLYKMK